MRNNLLKEERKQALDKAKAESKGLNNWMLELDYGYVWVGRL